MEDGTPQATAGASALGASPPPLPPAPNPNADARAGSIDSGSTNKSDEPIICQSEDWDINSISAIAALHMLIDALTALSNVTGDVPPTPPVTRPSSPKELSRTNKNNENARPPCSTPPTTKPNPSYPTHDIGSPEAHPTEPLPSILTTRPLTPTPTPSNSKPTTTTLDLLPLTRRFFSKTPPPFTLKAYLQRFHSWCPHSAGVYLAAAAYIHKLCVLDLLVPATARTIHRLALASIRIASKALEDNKWPQERVANVGGVGLRQLLGLEIAVCFLLDFELGVGEGGLGRGMFLLQQAGRHGLGTKSVRGEFVLRLPAKQKMRVLNNGMMGSV